MAKEAFDPRREKHVGDSYVALSVFRLMIALVYSGFAICLVSSDDGFMSAYLRYSTPAVCLSAINAVGLLDGKSKSGLAGVSQAMPFVSVALTLPVCTGFSLHAAGAIVGAAYSIGMLLCIAVQVRVAKHLYAINVRGAQAANVMMVAVKSVSYMLTPLPMQALFRGQIYLANVFLSSQAIATFIYARQMIGVGYQLTTFVLRTDLQKFANELHTTPLRPLNVLVSSSAVKASVVITFIIAVLGFTVFASHSGMSVILLVYSVSVTTQALSSTLQRAYLLTDRAHVAVWSLTIPSFLAILYAFLLASRQGIYAIIFCEILSHIGQVILLSLAWRSSFPAVGRMAKH